MDKGRFITVEGGDGAGKSTHVPYIETLLEKNGIEVVVTREPGGTRLGEKLRELLLNYSDGSISDETELLLMFAARKQHMDEVLQPALSRGVWVVCDRFTDASYAYQGGGRGIPDERIEILENWVQQGLTPDLTLLLDVAVATGLDRTDSRDGQSDRFEQQESRFKERVRQVYLDRAKRFPERITVIDAGQNLDAVQRQISDAIQQFIRNCSGGRSK